MVSDFKIPPLTGIDCVDTYNREGRTMDKYLGGEISWDHAVMWAKEMKADVVLKMLMGQYYNPGGTWQHPISKMGQPD